MPRVVDLNYRTAYAVALTGIDGRILELLAPVFREEFAAEVMAEHYPLSQAEGTPEAEKKLAKDIEAFIDAWDEAHGDDERYPTPDGHYPKPRLMANWFGESRKSS